MASKWICHISQLSAEMIEIHVCSVRLKQQQQLGLDSAVLKSNVQPSNVLSVLNLPNETQKESANKRWETSEWKEEGITNCNNFSN